MTIDQKSNTVFNSKQFYIVGKCSNGCAYETDEIAKYLSIYDYMELHL